MTSTEPTEPQLLHPHKLDAIRARHRTGGGAWPPGVHYATQTDLDLRALDDHAQAQDAIIATLTAERDRARDIAVRFEQDINAQQPLVTEALGWHSSYWQGNVIPGRPVHETSALADAIEQYRERIGLSGVSEATT